MPSGIESGAGSKLSDAISEVDRWLRALPGGARKLSADELRGYSTRKPVAGWRMTVELQHSGRQELDVLIDEQFPRREPRIALFNAPPFLTVPHIEKDGVLCLLPDTAEADPFEPVNVVRYVMHAAVDLLEEALSGKRIDDFQAEFQSYWQWSCSPEVQPIQSMAEPSGPTRALRVWRGRGRYVIAECDEELLRWLDNLWQNAKAGPRKTETALFLWLNEALIPANYPRSVADVQKIAAACGGAELFQELIDLQPDRLVVVLGAPTANGPCFGGVLISPPITQSPSGRRGRKDLTSGFRPNKVPKAILTSRFVSNATIDRTIVERVDALWIHGRGQDQRIQRLRKATVAVFGCGSVGAAAAVALAKAGVGRMILVDPQVLAWANTGRHPLGAGAVGQPKAVSLANRLRADFPHAQIYAWDTTWQQAAKNHAVEIASSDLIVSAMGDWAAEGALNEWHLENGRSVPIVYGWTEPHAAAGHAVAILADGGCLQCNVDSTGLPLLRVTEWPVSTIKQEPGCGAVYQPYGPVELENIVSLIVELAIDGLLGAVTTSTHRIWTSRSSLVTAAGGKWTAEWESTAGARTYGAFVEERPWPEAQACPECSADQKPYVSPSAAPASLSSSAIV